MIYCYIYVDIHTDISSQSVQFSHSIVSDSLRPHESQHARPPCPSPSPGVHSDSPPSSRWCHPAILSSVVPFSFCPHSLPASGSFTMSQLFTWGHIPWENHNWKRHIHLNVHCSSIYITAWTWKQPRCPSTDEWIKKLWYIYTMEYYSAIKMNTFETVLVRQMNLEPIIKS